MKFSENKKSTISINHQSSALPDALKHIRIIHYALVISCLILIVASERNDTFYHRVIDQLQDGKAVIKEYYKGWFQAHIYNNYSAKNIEFKKYYGIGGYICTINTKDLVDVTGDEIPISDTREIYIPKWFSESDGKIQIFSLSEENKNWYKQTGIQIDEFSPDNNLSHSLNNILNFFQNLNKIGNIYIVKNPPEDGYFGDAKKIIRTKITEVEFETAEEINGYLSDHQIAIPSFSVTNNASENSAGIILNYQYIVNPKYFKNFNNFLKFHITVDTEKIDSEKVLSQFFYDSIRIRNFQYDTIKTHFKDMFDVPEYFWNMDINELESYLNDMKNTVMSDVKLFGINIPRANLSSWGIILIISCQIYIFLHLNSLNNDYDLSLIDSTPIIASILCYTSNSVSRYCCYCSISIFPPFTIAETLRKTLDVQNPYNLKSTFFISIFLVSLFISRQTFMLIRLWYKKIRVSGRSIEKNTLQNGKEWGKKMKIKGHF